MASGERWNRAELLIVMNVYEKLPFGQFDQNNAVIKDIARQLNRTPSSVSMKLCNLASLDPALKARGRKGLEGASKLDKIVWNEFHNNRETLGPESEEAFRNLFSAHEGDEVDLVKGTGVRVLRCAASLPPTGPTEQEATVTVRRGQQFFRQMILNAFDSRCCITGIDVRVLLVASHIKPWGSFPEERLNIENGLCLSRLHDAAFDRGLISFDDDYRLLIGSELRRKLRQPSLELNFGNYAGKRIAIPSDSLGPNKDFLRYHREKIFHD
jgi:putative restriction endonuclease